MKELTSIQRVLKLFMKQTAPEMNIVDFPNRIDFPSLRQSSQYSCGALSVQMILLYYGFDVREGVLINEMGVNQTGVNFGIVQKAFEKRGFRIFTQAGCTLEDLRRWVDQKLPVLIDIQACSETKPEGWEDDVKNSHYAVVIGYSDKAVLLADPASIYRAYLLNDDFLRRWHGLSDDGNPERGWVMVPYGMTPKYRSDRVTEMG